MASKRHLPVGQDWGPGWVRPGRGSVPGPGQALAKPRGTLYPLHIAMIGDDSEGDDLDSISDSEH